MNLRVAVSASRVEGGLRSRTGRATRSADPVSLVTLQAEKGLIAREKVVPYRTVRSVAFRAVIHEIRMFKSKRTFLFRVAHRTRLLYGCFPKELV